MTCTCHSEHPNQLPATEKTEQWKDTLEGKNFPLATQTHRHPPPSFSSPSASRNVPIDSEVQEAANTLRQMTNTLNQMKMRHEQQQQTALQEPPQLYPIQQFPPPSTTLPSFASMYPHLSQRTRPPSPPSVHASMRPHSAPPHGNIFTGYAVAPAYRKRSPPPDPRTNAQQKRPANQFFHGSP